MWLGDEYQRWPRPAPPRPAVSLQNGGKTRSPSREGVRTVCARCARPGRCAPRGRQGRVRRPSGSPYTDSLRPVRSGPPPHRGESLETTDEGVARSAVRCGETLPQFPPRPARTPTGRRRWAVRPRKAKGCGAPPGPARPRPRCRISLEHIVVLVQVRWRGRVGTMIPHPGFENRGVACRAVPGCRAPAQPAALLRMQEMRLGVA